MVRLRLVHAFILPHMLASYGDIYVQRLRTVLAHEAQGILTVGVSVGVPRNRFSNKACCWNSQSAASSPQGPNDLVLLRLGGREREKRN